MGVAERSSVAVGNTAGGKSVMSKDVAKHVKSVVRIASHTRAQRDVAKGVSSACLFRVCHASSTARLEVKEDENEDEEEEDEEEGGTPEHL